MLEPSFKSIRAFSDDRGYSYFDIFQSINDGQINLGYLQPGIVKGMHFHQYQEDNWMCFQGDIHVLLVWPKRWPTMYIIPPALYQSKDPNDYHFKHYYIGEHNPGVLNIPKFVLHGYSNVSNSITGLLYWVTKPYDPQKPDELRVKWDHWGKELWLPENK